MKLLFCEKIRHWGKPKIKRATYCLELEQLILQQRRILQGYCLQQQMTKFSKNLNFVVKQRQLQYIILSF